MTPIVDAHKQARRRKREAAQFKADRLETAIEEALASLEAGMVWGAIDTLQEALRQNRE